MINDQWVAKWQFGKNIIRMQPLSRLIAHFKTSYLDTGRLLREPSCYLEENSQGILANLSFVLYHASQAMGEWDHNEACDVWLQLEKVIIYVAWHGCQYHYNGKTDVTLGGALIRSTSPLGGASAWRLKPLYPHLSRAPSCEERTSFHRYGRILI